MFKVRCYYNPIVTHHSDGKMSVSIILSNGKKSKNICNFYDRDYKLLMKFVKKYVELKNEHLKSSFKFRMKKLLSIYI